MKTEQFIIKVGARESPLSKVQVQEVLSALQAHHPEISFETFFVLSKGDKDQKTSLRHLQKTDFFTREIDEMVLKGICQVGIHSAKDLPEPLPEGLRVVALTEGLDPSDVLVIRHGETLDSLPPKAIIATSSERREAAVRMLRPDFTFVDLRGTIEQRLEKLEKGEADGVVVAMAALIRLGLTHLNLIKIPGETVHHQGRLAIVARKGDQDMSQLFGTIDARKSQSTILYLGLNPPLLSCLVIMSSITL